VNLDKSGLHFSQQKKKKKKAVMTLFDSHGLTAAPRDIFEVSG
jgi:hypothetical protein